MSDLITGDTTYYKNHTMMLKKQDLHSPIMSSEKIDKKQSIYNYANDNPNNATTAISEEVLVSNPEENSGSNAWKTVGLVALGIGITVAGFILKKKIKPGKMLENITNKTQIKSYGIASVTPANSTAKTLSKALPKTQFKSADEYQEFLKTLKDNGGYIKYSESDIQGLKSMYMEQPDLIEYLSLKQGDIMSSYNRYQIEDLFNLHKTNPNLVERFVLKNWSNGDVYNANDIIEFIEASKINSSLAEKLLSQEGRWKRMIHIREAVEKADSDPNVYKMLNAKTFNRKGKTEFAYSGWFIINQINNSNPKKAFLMSLNHKNGYKLLSENEIEKLLEQSDGLNRANVMIDFCSKNPKYSKILKLMASNFESLNSLSEDLFYIRDLSGNRVINKKMCDYMLKHVADSEKYFSVNRPYLNDLYEINVINARGGKNIRFRLDRKGAPIKEEIEIYERINKDKKITEHMFGDGTSIRQNIEYHNIKGYDLEVPQSYRKEILDSTGKVVRSEEIIPSLKKPGEFSIIVESGGEREIVGLVREYGSKSQGTRIGRKLVSADGTITKQVKIEGPKGGSSKYIINDKSGKTILTCNRKYRKISENHYTSSLNNQNYDIQFLKDEIRVKQFDINGNFVKEVKVTPDDIDFRDIELFKKFPGDFFVKLKEMGIKMKRYPQSVDMDVAGGACYEYGRKLIKYTKKDLFVLAHEFGHALDRVYLKNLCENKKLLKIFLKELKKYKASSTNLEGKAIDYFTNSFHKDTGECLAELIAETNALLSGLPTTKMYASDLGLRSITLQQNFPETIAFIAQKIC